MTTVDVNDFLTEKECTYDGERYSVRDNGAVYRHTRPGKRERAADGEWTFGKVNSSNQYLHIGDARIHRIVATAFHGDPPDPKYVVDHIDTNCRNNRPENLRWLTRLENTLLNPVTRKKIEFLCGSIDAFLENPSMLNNMKLEPNVSWVRTVTREEAQNCKMRMDIWARSGKKPTTVSFARQSSFSGRIHKPIQKWEAGLGGEPGLDLANTPRCGQYMWRADMYFPCCPNEVGADPLDSYFQNIKVGAVFSYSDHSFCPKTTIIEIEKSKNGLLIIKCEQDGPKPFLVSGIDVNEEGYFIHFYLGSYSDQENANKVFRDAIGLADLWSASYNAQMT